MAYTGPLDLVTPSNGWWGLRAASAAKCGTKCCQVRRSSDNALADINSTAAGDFDNAAFTAHVGGGSGFVSKLYDQSGNARDAVQATAANQPQIILNTFGVGTKPGLFHVAASAQTLIAPVGASNVNLPYTVTAVAERTSNFTTLQTITYADFAQFNMYFVNNPNLVFSSGSGNLAAADSALHDFVSVNPTVAANADFMIDGTAHGFTSTAALLVGPGSFNLASRGTSDYLDGYLQEVGLWPSAFTGTNETDMHTNMLYWNAAIPPVVTSFLYDGGIGQSNIFQVRNRLQY